MPINLRKYNGRYVEILYGSEDRLRGKLVGNKLLEYSGNISFDGRNLFDEYEINPANINAIRDVTREMYEQICGALSKLGYQVAQRSNPGEYNFPTGEESEELNRLEGKKAELEKLLGIESDDERLVSLVLRTLKFNTTKTQQ